MTPPSKEFLEELVERCRRIGWSVDYTEIWNLLEILYDQAGLPVPNLEPYDKD